MQVSFIQRKDMFSVKSLKWPLQLVEGLCQKLKAYPFSFNTFRKDFVFAIVLIGHPFLLAV